MSTPRFLREVTGADLVVVGGAPLLGLAALVLFAGGCGSPSGDLFEVVRSGADKNANVRILVSDDGTVRCNKGKPVPMGAKRLLTARQLARDLDTQAALALELPKGSGRDPVLHRATRGREDLLLGPVARAARLVQPPRRLHERRRQGCLQARAMTDVGRVAGCGATRSSRWPASRSRRRRVLARPGRRPPLGLHPRRLERSGFPWLTMRERRHGPLPPAFAEPDRPDDSPHHGAHARRGRPRRRRPGAGRRARRGRARHQAGPRGLRHDAALAHHHPDDRGLSALVGSELDVRRFRPNLLVEAPATGRSPRTPGSAACCGSAGADARRQARRALRHGQHRPHYHANATRRSCAPSPASARHASASTARPCCRAASRWATRSSSTD